MIPRLGGMTLSVLLHAGLVALLLAWSATEWPRPLYVDLDLVERAEPGAGRAIAPPPAGSSRPPGPASRPAPATGRGEPAAPSPTPVAPPATSTAPPAVPLPPPAALTVPAESQPLVASAPPPASSLAPAPAPAAAPDTMGARGGLLAGGDAGSAARGGAPVREDADSGPGGAAGAPLALATPGSGGAGTVPPEYGPYLRGFRQRVLESLIYPLAARRQGLGGTVELHVRLEPTGRVGDVQVARSSSHAILDEAAVETIRRLGPVPFPESLPRRPLLIRVPLVFELR